MVSSQMIAHFTYNLDKYSGAAQQAALVAKTTNIECLFFNHNSSKLKKWKLTEKIDVVDLPGSFFAQFFIILFYTISRNIKIFHMHGPFRAGLFLAILTRRKSILKTTLLGEDDFLSLKCSRFGALKTFLAKRVTINVVLSNRLYEINSKFIPENKILKIPNGVLIPKNAVTLAEKSNSFCFVGLVCPRKRTLESIKYFHKNYSHIDGAKLYIVGPHSGLENNTEVSQNYINTCLEFVKVNKLEHCVVFTENLKKEEVFAVYKESKALLFFSEKEGMPNSVLEAMSYNCVPIVTPMEGVMKEVLEHGSSGFILENTDSSVPLYLLDDTIESQNSFLNCREKFSIEEVGSKYLSLYYSLINFSGKDYAR